MSDQKESDQYLEQLQSQWKLMQEMETRLHAAEAAAGKQAVLKETLELMAEYRVIQMPFDGGVIVRPLPPEEPKAKSKDEDELERFMKMNPAEQDAALWQRR